MLTSLSLSRCKEVAAGGRPPATPGIAERRGDPNGTRRPGDPSAAKAGSRARRCPRVRIFRLRGLRDVDVEEGGKCANAFSGIGFSLHSQPVSLAAVYSVLAFRISHGEIALATRRVLIKRSRTDFNAQKALTIKKSSKLRTRRSDTHPSRRQAANEPTHPLRRRPVPAQSLSFSQPSEPIFSVSPR